MSDLVDLRLRHLEVIQSVINRLAQNSFTVRGWSVTLASVIFALITTQTVANELKLLTLAPIWLFWGLDAFYLHQERLYRRLYSIVAASLSTADEEPAVPLFDMDISRCRPITPSAARTAFSISVAAIPVMLTLVVVGFYLVS